MRNFRWLVIGGGPGGIVSARNLSARFPGEVGLLESGPRPDDVKPKPYSLSEIRHFYRNSGLNYFLGFPLLFGAEGHCLGGGSQINSGIYYRLPEALRARWESHFFVENFTASSLAPHYAEIEALLELEVPHRQSEIQAFDSAGAELGLEGLGPKVWWGKSQRVFLSKIIQDCEKKGHLSVRCNLRVRSIERLQNKWKIETSSGETFLTENLVLACGSLGSQQMIRPLLQTRLANPIFFHPIVRVVGRTSISQRITRDHVTPFQWANSEVTIGFSTPSRVHIKALAGAGKIQDAADLISLYGSPKNPGRIRSLFLHGRSLSWVVPSTRYLRDLRLARQTLEDFATKSGLRQVVPVSKVSAVHFMGGLPFGASDSCPLDSYGKVKALPKVFVADGSVMNSALGVNPQGTIIMLAQRNSSQWIENSEK